jgi:hypothetical protein
MGGLSVNFGPNEINNNQFKSASKEKAWQEATGVMQKIETVAYDAVRLDGTEADKNKMPGDVMVIGKKWPAGGEYSAHVKFDEETKRLLSADIDTEKFKLTLSGSYPKMVYSEKNKYDGVEKRLGIDFSKDTADYKHLHGQPEKSMHPHGQSSQNLPQKVYTIKPGETDNFKSIGHQLAYEKGMEIKKEVESLGKSLIELDGKQGVDRNPEKGFVTLGGKEQIHEGRVEFDPKSLDLKRVSLHDNAEDVQYNKTVHKDRTEYSKDEGTGKDIFIEYKDTGEMKFLKQEKLAKRE